MPTTQPSVWTSLEIAKLLASLSTPIAVAIFGYLLSRSLKSIEDRQWERRKIVAKRVKVYEDLVPELNDLLCYFLYVGNWKEKSPPEVIAIKRKLDKVAYVNAPLFPADFLTRYEAFMRLCYSTYNKWGDDAKLRTLSRRRSQYRGTEWNSDWNEYFTEEENHEPQVIKVAYQKFVEYLARQLGVGLKPKLDLPVEPSWNY